MELAARVVVSMPLPYRSCKNIAGADVSYDIGAERFHAAVVVIDADSGEIIERSGVVDEARFPYVPGLLSFREAPAVLKAFEGLKTSPDVVLVDGQGLAHPRRIGLACHLGLWLDIPTIGCAKSLLTGHYEEPGPERGCWSFLTDRGETIGAVVRTRARVRPLYVSPGHLCDLPSAIEIVLKTAPKHRLPIPSRLSHQYVNELRKNDASSESGGM